jgi:hypothetical protein
MDASREKEPKMTQDEARAAMGETLKTYQAEGIEAAMVIFDTLPEYAQDALQGILDEFNNTEGNA